MQQLLFITTHNQSSKLPYKYRDVLVLRFLVQLARGDVTYAALRLWAYISGKSQVPMLQLLLVST